MDAIRLGFSDYGANLKEVAAQVIELIKQQEDDRQRGLVDVQFLAQFVDKMYARNINFFEHISPIRRVGFDPAVGDPPRQIRVFEAERPQIAQVAGKASVAFDGLWLRLDDRARFARVQARPPEASDADLAVAQSQADQHVIVPEGWTCLDAGASFANLQARVASVLVL